MRRMGFSTGSIALGDFRRALEILDGTRADAIELSALRPAELPVLVELAGHLNLTQYKHISVHAPSTIPPENEIATTKALRQLAARGWPVVVHPDTISTFDLWRDFGKLLFIENMDKRKPTGRTAGELERMFDRLPDAALCFDIAHARQVDSSMTEAYLILSAFRSRIGQLHMSEVRTDSHHARISIAATRDFQEVAQLIPPSAPAILETPVGRADIETELLRAAEALTRTPSESSPRRFNLKSEPA